jgi:glycosyltransferase involved in cell wall biosynthesis
MRNNNNKLKSMHKDFSLTVLMTVYNGEKYLAEAIASILNQTYTNFEFLIIDDGSTDKSKTIIKAYASDDKRIRYIRTNHRGRIEALNLGLKEAVHDWIALQDCDDVSLPYRLQKQIEIIKGNPRIEVLSSYGYYIGPKSSHKLGLVKIGPENEQSYWQLVKNNKHIFLLNTAVVMHKETVIRAGGYRTSPLVDLDLWSRLGDIGELMLVVNEPLVLCRRLFSSMTSRDVFDYQRRMRWIKKCMIERRVGREEPTYSTYCMSEKSAPLIIRFNQYRKDLGGFLYKNFGINLAFQRYVRGLSFALAALIVSPQYFLKKIVLQQRGMKRKKI